MEDFETVIIDEAAQVSQVSVCLCSISRGTHRERRYSILLRMFAACTQSSELDTMLAILRPDYKRLLLFGDKQQLDAYHAMKVHIHIINAYHQCLSCAALRQHTFTLAAHVC